MRGRVVLDRRANDEFGLEGQLCTGSFVEYDERRARPGTCLMAIARNVLIDHLRRDRSALREPVELEDRDPRLPVVGGPGSRWASSRG